MVRAVTDRERAEFERLGVTLCAFAEAGASGRGCSWAALPDLEALEVWDWPLLRKFNAFWPSTMAGPHDLPWLGDLVTRDRAWRWASQFPTFFAQVEAADTAVIRAFVARTLTEVEPPSSADTLGSKSCCKRRTPPTDPPDPPIDDNPKCTQDHWIRCDGCPPGTGTLYYIWPDCSEQQAGGDCAQIAPQCPGMGPIEPEEVVWG